MRRYLAQPADDARSRDEWRIDILPTRDLRFDGRLRGYFASFCRNEAHFLCHLPALIHYTEERMTHAKCIHGLRMPTFPRHRLGHICARRRYIGPHRLLPRGNFGGILRDCG